MPQFSYKPRPKPPPPVAGADPPLAGANPLRASAPTAAPIGSAAAPARPPASTAGSGPTNALAGASKTGGGGPARPGDEEQMGLGSPRPKGETRPPGAPKPGDNGRTQPPATTPAEEEPTTSPGIANPDDGINWQDVQNNWADVLAQHDKGLKDEMYGIDADEARNARRASETNAMMGGSVGGGFQGGQIQAQLSGTLARSKATAEHNMNAVEMKMSFLDKMFQEAMRQGDRELQLQIQDEMNATSIQLEEMRGKVQMAGMEGQLEGTTGDGTADSNDSSGGPTGGHYGQGGASYDYAPGKEPWRVGGEYGNPANYSDGAMKAWEKRIGGGYEAVKRYRDQTIVDGMNQGWLTSANKQQAMAVYEWYIWTYGIGPTLGELAGLMGVNGYMAPPLRPPVHNDSPSDYADYNPSGTTQHSDDHQGKPAGGTGPGLTF